MKLTIFSLIMGGIVFTGCNDTTPQFNDPIPVYQTFDIISEAVGEKKIINVWTPPNYDSTTDSFTVIYMADGGIKEDFPHIANTFDSLIKTKAIPPVIVVGIENTVRRRDLSGPTEVAKDKEIAPIVGGSGKFRTFVKEELMPEISKKYRTNGKDGILGESLSGYFVMETFFEDPNMFDYYIAFDPSIWWNNAYYAKNSEKLLRQLSDSMPIKRIWFAGSDATDINPHTQLLASNFTKVNPLVVQWHYADEPKEQHSTIFRNTKHKAIIWTLNQK